MFRRMSGFFTPVGSSARFYSPAGVTLKERMGRGENNPYRKQK